MPGWQDRPYRIAPAEQFREGPDRRDGQFRHLKKGNFICAL